jgi:YihY family inner membrane protein
VFDEAQVLSAIGAYLEFVVPGQSSALVGELRNFLTHRELVGWLLLALMLFFSTLAFTVLENAMSVIFFHRVAVRRRRHFLISAVMPYLFILSLAIGLLIITVVSGALSRLGTHAVVILGESRPLDLFSARLLYLVGVAGEIFLLTAIYLVMPVGRLSLRHALIGGTAAAILWEITRHVLVWYYSTISQIQVVYGSLTTSIAVLLSVEIGAIVLLLGAQVIAEYERIDYEPIDIKAKSMQAEKA